VSDSTPPQTRQEAAVRAESAESEPQPAELPTVLYGTAELLEAPSEDFLPLNVRRVLYLAGLAALVVAPLISVQAGEYGEAIATAGNLLGAVGLGTALANPSRR
jgi:hypothetical protein